MQIFLIRHGETQWSLTGKHTGRTDVPLTDHGEKSASNLCEPLQRIKFSHVFTSPRLRARRTCELAGLEAEAQVESDLQEWDYGDYEGWTAAEIRAKRPEWTVFENGCPGGESVEQICQRADRLVAKLHSLEGPIALFSHGHFLRVLAVRWIGLPVKQGTHFALDTASVSLLGLEGHGIKIPAISLWNAGPNVALPTGQPGAQK
ncbi:MAG TPA: histidine phosphatase family protein [Opitutaceae bacterium]|nr:histidine phosphatase family protein [Opitutaceae bacterium]